MYKFKAYNKDYELPFGIEYADDSEGNEIIECEWFSTEAERDNEFNKE